MAGRWYAANVGIVAAAAMFGERLGPLFALGVFLILGGLALAVAADRAPKGGVANT